MRSWGLELSVGSDSDHRVPSHSLTFGPQGRPTHGHLQTAFVRSHNQLQFQRQLYPRSGKRPRVLRLGQTKWTRCVAFAEADERSLGVKLGDFDGSQIPKPTKLAQTISPVVRPNLQALGSSRHHCFPIPFLIQSL